MAHFSSIDEFDDRDRQPPDDEGRQRRPAYRPPIGIPIDAAPNKRAALASVLLHLLIIALVLAPPIVAASRFEVDNQGAGGPGAVGGGGGGNRGTGGIFEHITPEKLRYVQLTPPAPQKTAAPVPTPVPVKKPVPPVPPPKVEEKKPEPQPEPAKPQADAKTESTAPSTAVESKVPGTGGGTGADGTAGSGPGSGGGVGSGVGTGRGSGNGPGTGGGDAKVYPPTVIAMPILPIPVPSKVRPYTLQAFFEVDTLGNAKLLGYNPSNDGGYNKRIREMLAEVRFRPAVRANGRPVLDTAKIIANAP